MFSQSTAELLVIFNETLLMLVNQMMKNILLSFDDSEKIMEQLSFLVVNRCAIYGSK